MVLQNRLSKWVFSLRPSDAHMRQWINQYCFIWWLVAWSLPSHYLNQFWNIVNWTLRNKLQWIFFEMLAFSFNKMLLKMSSVKWQPFCLGLNVLRISNYIPQKITDVITYPWWRHQMETFSASLAFCAENSPVPGEFSAQRSVTRSFDVFFDLRLNKRLSKQSWGWWFETLSRPLWRHRNAVL